MKQTRIGIVLSKIGSHFTVNDAYLSYIQEHGVAVPISALDSEINTNIDMLIIPGGSDVNPLRYKAIPHYSTGNPNIQMEFFDTVVLPKYIQAGIPIIGICRGFQSLNVHFGGTLTQDFPFPYSAKSRGEDVEKTLFTKAFQDTWCASLIKPQPFGINSLHHQGVFITEYENQLAQPLIPIFISDKSKNVECFIHNNLPIFAVQYHPEEINDVFTSLVIKRFASLNK